MTQRLITTAQRAHLLANAQAYGAGQGYDAEPVTRLFTPDARASWLLAALDPSDGNTAFGLCDVGVGLPGLGYVKLSDLESITGPRGRPILQDRYFQPTRTLREYVRLAQDNGAIVD